MPSYLTLKEAAVEYGVTRSGMTRLVRRLGVRTHPNPRDHRSKLVEWDDLHNAMMGSSAVRWNTGSEGGVRDFAGTPAPASSLRDVRPALELPRESGLPPRGSAETRERMRDGLRVAAAWQERARREGWKPLATAEALAIVRGGAETDDDLR